MLTQGTKLRNGTYVIEKQLAAGGFGNTYMVRNVAFNEVFAVKEFFMRGVNVRNGNEVTVSVPDNHVSYEGQKEKFKKEAVRLRNLSNPHIVKVHDLFEENGTAYYVMDYIDGESVAERIKRTGNPITEDQALNILNQVLDALQTVHAQDIWHLDIKPGNIMLDRKGNAFLIDFGASKQFNKSSSQTSSALCYTPGYAPVEQVEQALDKFGPWTDLYALGATLYNMQTLRQPPTSTALAESDAFEFPNEMSQWMEDLIRWMMTPARKSRPQSVADVKRFLADLQEDRGEVVEKKQSKAWWKVLLPLVIIAALGVGAYFLFFAKSSELRLAEDNLSKYEKLVKDCKKTIKNADDIVELSEAEEMLSDIEDLEDRHSREMPEEYDKYDDLKSQYRETLDQLKDDYKEMASDYLEEGECKSAYDMYKEASEALPDDDDLENEMNEIAEKMGYLYVTDLEFANRTKDAVDIEAAGSRLHADKMRYLFPKVIYNSLLPEGNSIVTKELGVKIFSPDGTFRRSSSSPAGYTYKSSISIAVGEVDQGEWLLGWGNETESSYEEGTYTVEIYYEDVKLFSDEVTLY